MPRSNPPILIYCLSEEAHACFRGCHNYVRISSVPDTAAHCEIHPAVVRWRAGSLGRIHVVFPVLPGGRLCLCAPAGQASAAQAAGYCPFGAAVCSADAITGVAVGFHYREDEILDTPGDVVLAGNAWQDDAAGITAGDDTFTAFFGEIDIPLLANLPAVEYLDVNLSARYTFKDNASINMGVSNITDKYYQEHLNGVNRVRMSDVPVGETLPGRGRSAFINLRYDW